MGGVCSLGERNERPRGSPLSSLPLNMCFQVGAGLDPCLQMRELLCQVTPLGTRHAGL